jgi:predicted GTPase
MAARHTKVAIAGLKPIKVLYMIAHANVPPREMIVKQDQNKYFQPGYHRYLLRIISSQPGLRQ